MNERQTKNVREDADLQRIGNNAGDAHFAVNHASLPAERQPLLLAMDVAKRYWTQDGDPIDALREISVGLGSGEFVSIVGPSGCGKSTLMKILGGIVPSTRGRIFYKGRAVDRAQRGMGIVFQSPVLLPWLNVLENTLLPSRVLKLKRQIAEPRARELLETVGLKGFENKYPNELSGGMQQRVGIVRSLVHDPDMLLMDEPFGALDALTRERMNLELQRVWLATRKTIFFITHSIPEAVFLSDRVLVMSERPGRIIAEFVIPFARPRSFDLTGTAEFGEKAIAIRHLLGATADV
jgi:NitT/TauT family transport system ATP-binding protein